MGFGMSIVVGLHHTTHYVYERDAALGMQTIRLRPAPHASSKVKSYSLKILPKGHYINWQQDPFGNFLAKVVFPEKIKEFKIEVDIVAEIRPFNPFDFFLEDYAKDFPFKYEKSLKEELVPYLEIKERNTKLLSWISEANKDKQNIIDFLVQINQKLNHTLKYVVRLEAGVQNTEETLNLGTGSCRDMAWLLCQALRHLGLATRFASGYLIQLVADVESLDGPSGTKVDFTDLHAWTEVYLPGAGWVGLDPTSGLFAGEGHIPLCCTPNPSSSAPVTGTLEERIKGKLHHDMKVERIIEIPRVTKPYLDNEWKEIDELGKKVDEKLKKQDVRLTMGGEPTFVSLDDREDKAWHYSALGGNKKELAKNLFDKLSDRFSNGYVKMFSQGKWYPNEELPRWSMQTFWRKDGQILWKDKSLLANPEKASNNTLKTAKKFMDELSCLLGIPSLYVMNAYEAKDSSVSGYVLPLHYSQRRKRWISNKWKFESGALTLLQGDSPIGFRIPLNTIPSPKEAKLEQYSNHRSIEKLKAFSAYDKIQKSLASNKKQSDKEFEKDKSGLIKTALCVEIRNGVLHVFLPPLIWAEYFVELIVAIEMVAKDLKVSVVLEGYNPPIDIRLSSFSVTPDPGVIEVNVQPASNWEELKIITNAIYEEARLCRLSAEKFMLDGRRVGTGGGNHVVLGSSTPENSPFLKRPDLLKSIISFWQNHPSLSYLFSGMYIGPTSQSPRIDEARHDSLYELEIAFQQLTEKERIEPSVIDKLFRNLLVDVTGNTHRAEFCIDKLYSPDTDRGKLGLLEMRGFEMSPHPQMNLLQGLLVRAIISCFWDKPYNAKLIRWGTQLEDKFMLPHYVWEDFKDVLEILESGGYNFKPEWFNSFMIFRFPLCGIAEVDDVTLSIHTALEPWPVLGEEATRSGMSRSVDTTVERLQVKVTGLVEGRHIVTCNGRKLPLTKTNVQGVQIAGVRFKAWSDTSSLHPELPIDTPLVFDVIDILNQKSLGGCKYHACHPGGRSYDTFPVNENEAEGRKVSRFESIGHTPGKIVIPKEEINAEFPHTLDLRFKY